MKARGVAIGLLLAVACLAGPAAARAQSASCLDPREALAAFERGSAIGQFEGEAQLLTCMSSLPRVDQARAFELLARSYVAQGRLDDADQAIAELMRRNADFTPAPSDPPLFVELVDRARQYFVRSVSKFAEDSREAPASVTVITSEEIQRRGYRDLEAVLHDLPGFDFARGNGNEYSTISQRGYPSSATDHMLVLLDGIEQNDLHSNIAYLSRQYPLTLIDRIEVVYGPASTMYGPNAFTGVVDIITRDPDAMVGSHGQHAAKFFGGAGAFGTTFEEATYAGRTDDGGASWSVTGRFYHSNEPDLSGQEPWKYGFPDAFDNVDYVRSLELEGKTLDKYLCATLAPGATGHVLDHPDRCAVPTPQAARVQQAVAAGLAEARDVNGDGYLEIVPTALGVQRARALDRALWNGALKGQSLSFTDSTRDWFLAAKVKFGDFTLGMQTWQAVEGTTPWYTDRSRGEGGTWIPRQAVIFARYARPITTNLALTVLLRYKNDQLDASRQPILATYASGYFGLLDLLGSTPAQAATVTLDEVSTQFRSDFAVVYERSERIRAIVGADIRDGSKQAPFFVAEDGSLPSFPAIPNPDDLKATDVGVFGQVSYDWRRRLKVIFGLRYDSNQVRENEEIAVRTDIANGGTLVPVTDFGGFVSPRAAVVSRFGNRAGPLGQVIFKGIVSRASQQPSNLQRFASEPYVRELSSPFLTREKATNVDAVMTWQYDALVFDVDAYAVKYSDVPAQVLRVDPCCTPPLTSQFQNVGATRASGLQIGLNSTFEGYGVFANYTYARAVDLDPRDAYGEPITLAPSDSIHPPVGGIARHKLNAGVTRRWRRLDGSLRVNVVGDRPAGAAGSPLNSQTIPGYTALNGTLAFRDEAHRLTIQLALDNLLNQGYADPGVRGPAVLGWAPSAPQPRFNALIQAIFDLNVAGRRSN
jgi:outer membrane receptor protein involved in Fe transport